jgi:hypothetical protein
MYRWVKGDPICCQLVDHLSRSPVEDRETSGHDERIDTSTVERIFRDPNLRLSVEARLLATRSPEEVAAQVGLTPAQTRAYCDSCFDVLDSFAAKDWLRIHIFEADDDSSADLHSLICREAYRGGPGVCAHWLERLSCMEQECDLTTKRGREVKRLQLTLMQYQLRRRDWSPLSLAAIRTLIASPLDHIEIKTASEVVGRHIDNQLGKLLTRGENAHPTGQIDEGSHNTETLKKCSA